MIADDRPSCTCGEFGGTRLTSSRICPIHSDCNPVSARELREEIHRLEDRVAELQIRAAQRAIPLEELIEVHMDGSLVPYQFAELLRTELKDAMETLAKRDITIALLTEPTDESHVGAELDWLLKQDGNVGTAAFHVMKVFAKKNVETKALRAAAHWAINRGYVPGCPITPLITAQPCIDCHALPGSTICDEERFERLATIRPA